MGFTFLIWEESPSYRLGKLICFYSAISNNIFGLIWIKQLARVWTFLIERKLASINFCQRAKIIFVRNFNLYASTWSKSDKPRATTVIRKVTAILWLKKKLFDFLEWMQRALIKTPKEKCFLMFMIQDEHGLLKMLIFPNLHFNQ